MQIMPLLLPLRPLPLRPWLAPLLWQSLNLVLRTHRAYSSALPLYPLRCVQQYLARLQMAQSSCSFARCPTLLRFPYGKQMSCCL